MRQIIIIMAAIIAVTASKAQELKTYSGRFKNGVATYSYFENDDGRVFEGEFHWKGSGTAPGYITYKGDVDITGNFKNNKRDGLWIYTVTNREKRVNILKVNYDDGIPEGEYVYEENWDPSFFVGVKNKLSTSMHNGMPNGTVKIEMGNSVITGEYIQGTRTGTWKAVFPNGSYYHIVCNGSVVETKTDKYKTKVYDDRKREIRDGNFFYDVEDGSKKKATENDMLERGSYMIDEIFFDYCWELETIYSLENFKIIIPK